MPETTPIQFRLSDETLAELDALQEFLGLSSRAEVLRQAVRQMSRKVLGAVAPPPVKLPKAKRKPGRPKE